MQAQHQPKLILPFLAPLYDALSPLAVPAIRVVTGLMLVPHGYGKLFGGLEGTANFLESQGYAPGMIWATALGSLEFFGGIMLALGFLTRPVAVAVVVFMANAVLFHSGNGFLWTNAGFEYPLFWGVVALTFAIRGGGSYSLDAKLGREF